MRRHAAALLTTGLAVAFTGVGCGSGGGAKKAEGGGEQSKLARGRALFQSGPKGSNLSCGFCHTLRAAAADGSFGPSLDEEGREYQTLHYTKHRVRRFVRGWIENGRCLDPNEPSRCMPKGLLGGDEADAVAAFVAECAAKPSTGGCKPSAGGLGGEAKKGEHYYATLGCVSCHWSTGKTAVGPLFNGLAGSMVELANGKSVTADDDYLLASILDPDRDIVRGFQSGVMSSRVRPGQITTAQAKALVAYIETLK